VSGSTVSLSWTGGARATSYVLQAGSTSGASNLAAADIGNTTSYVATGVPNGTYYIRVVSKNACGSSAVSNEVVATVGGTTTTTTVHYGGTVDVFGITSQPFTATRTGPMTVALSWTDATVDLDLYLTDASCVGYPPVDCTLLASSTAVDTTSERITFSVTNGTSYKLWVDNWSETRSAPFGLDLTFTGTTTTTTALQFTPATTLSVTQGQFYTTSFASAATGGHPPYHFQLDTLGGFPPIGLILSPDGTLSGTATVSGTSTFRVCAVDLDGTSVCRSVAATVAQITVSPTSFTIAAAGGGGSVSVTAPSGATWTAASNSSFISVSAGTGRSGTGTVSFTVSANTGTSSRTGTLTVAGQTVTVTQSGAQGTTATTATGSIACTHTDNGVINYYNCTGSLSVTIGSGFTSGTSYVAFLDTPANPTSSFTAGAAGSTYAITIRFQTVFGIDPTKGACPPTQRQMGFFKLVGGVVPPGARADVVATVAIPVSCSGG
jgi:hypothetical protein